MSRLIDADAVMEQVDMSTVASVWLEEILNKQPTIDAEPVRHGKWANDAMGVLRCSECNAQAPWRYKGEMYDMVDYRWKANYCPVCGTRMDKDD